MIFCLECKAENIDCEFWLNDIPIVNRGPEHGWTFDGPVNQYLIDGKNELCLRLNLPQDIDKESEIDTEFLNEQGAILEDSSSAVLPEFERQYHKIPTDASVKAAIVRYPMGAISGGPDGTVIAEIEWNGVDIEQAIMWPRLETEHFILDEEFGVMHWQGAQQFEDVSSVNTDEIIEVIHKLHSALENREHNEWIALHELRLEDHDKAYQGPLGYRKEMAMMELKQSSLQPEFKMAPVETDTSCWRLVAEKRLVQCVAPDGLPNLREQTKENGTTDNYPLFMGKIDGTWHPLRG